jgi:hypothetical protein
VICAVEVPPRLSSKNLICFLPGLPSVIDHATIRPSRGITWVPRLVPILAW